MNTPFRKLLFLAAGMTASLHAEAIDIDSLMAVKYCRPVGLKTNMVTLQAGFNVGDEAGLAYELGYTWYPLRYAGLGFSLEFDDNQGLKDLIFSDEYSEYTYDSERVVRFNLHPTLAFRLPLVQWRRKGHMLAVQCNPGLVVSIPRNDRQWVTAIALPEAEGGDLREYGPRSMLLKNRDGRWLSWRVRSALMLCGDDAALALGWSVSDYNIMSCRNNMYHNGKRVSGYEHLSMTHSLFVAVSYCF